MKALRRWLARRREARPAARPAVDERAVSLARPFAERLADDERLRGELTDDGFGPLLSWATDLLVHAAHRIGLDPDAGAAMDAAGSGARALVGAISRAAASGDLAPVAAALAPPLLTPAEQAGLRDALPRDLSACVTPDERARRIVAALAAALPGGPG